MEQAKTMLTHVVFASDAYSCVEDADALVIVTEWDAFRALDLRVKTLWLNPILLIFAISIAPKKCVAMASPIRASAGIDCAPNLICCAITTSDERTCNRSGLFRNNRRRSNPSNMRIAGNTASRQVRIALGLPGKLTY